MTATATPTGDEEQTPTPVPGIISSAPVTSAVVGEPYLYLVEFGPGADAADADAAAFTLEAAVLPAWLELTAVDEQSAELAGVPTAEDTGEHAVELVLSAVDAAQLTQIFTITVSAPPNPIQASDLALETDEDIAAVASIAATHVADDLLTFAVATEPLSGTVTLFDPTQGDFEYLPAPDFAGEGGFVVEIADSQGVTATVLVSVTVLPVDDAPRLAPLPELALRVGEEVELPLEVLEPDGQAYTVAVAGLPRDWRSSPTPSPAQWPPRRSSLAPTVWKSPWKTRRAAPRWPQPPGQWS